MFITQALRIIFHMVGTDGVAISLPLQNISEACWRYVCTWSAPFMPYGITQPIYDKWNLFIMGTLRPAVSGSFLLLYRGFPLSEVKMY